MAAENVTNFYGRQLRHRRAEVGRARPGGFLGGVVWAVQAAGARLSTRWRAMYAGKVTVGKLNVDENPNVSFVPDPRHSDDAALQGRPGGRIGRRPRAERRPEEGHRQACWRYWVMGAGADSGCSSLDCRIACAGCRMQLRRVIACLLQGVRVIVPDVPCWS